MSRHPAMKETVEISNEIETCRVPVWYPPTYRHEILWYLGDKKEFMKTAGEQMEASRVEADAIMKGLKPDRFAQFRTTKITESREAYARWQERVLDRYNHPEKYPKQPELMEYKFGGEYKIIQDRLVLSPSPSLVRELNKRGEESKKELERLSRLYEALGLI